MFTQRRLGPYNGFVELVSFVATPDAQRLVGQPVDLTGQLSTCRHR
jgi:hypothetical protein